jgi:hypothetical protein
VHLAGHERFQDQHVSVPGTRAGPERRVSHRYLIGVTDYARLVNGFQKGCDLRRSGYRSDCRGARGHHHALPLFARAAGPRHSTDVKSPPSSATSPPIAAGARRAVGTQMAKTLYMVIEHFKGRRRPVYRRFRERGRLAPQGLTYVSSCGREAGALLPARKRMTRSCWMTGLRAGATSLNSRCIPSSHQRKRPKGSPSAVRVHSPELLTRWWAHLAGALAVHTHKHCATILAKKIEDLREACAPLLIAAEHPAIGCANQGQDRRRCARGNYLISASGSSS